MLIDWFTVVAQAINFLILVWLLKRFLYKPILDAIDAREQRIAKTLAEAEEKKNAAQKQRDEFERKNQQINDERNTLVHQMKDEVNVKRQKLLDDAHQSADAVSAKRLEALQREQKTFADEIARQVQAQVFSISRKTLQDMADTGLEERITKVFTRLLHEMNGNARQELAEALTKYGIQPGRASVTGITPGVSGELQLNFGQPGVLVGAEFSVDLGALSTGRASRGDWLKDNAITTSRFPLAHFKATSIGDLPATYTEGQQVSFQLNGDLTIRDVTRPVTFDVTATLSGDTIRGKAVRRMQLTDFGIDPPSFINTLTVQRPLVISS